MVIGACNNLAPVYCYGACGYCTALFVIAAAGVVLRFRKQGDVATLNGYTVVAVDALGTLACAINGNFAVIDNELAIAFYAAGRCVVA